MQQIKISVKGMINSSSAQRIEAALLQENAISEAHVNYVNEIASAVFDERKMSAQMVVNIIQSEGFSCEEITHDFVIENEDEKIDQHLLFCAVLGALSVVTLGLPNFLKLITTTVGIVLFYMSYKTTLSAFSRGVLDHNLTTVIGALMLYLLSVIGFLFHYEHQYFSETLFALAFIFLGKYVENFLKYHQFDLWTEHFKNRPKTVIRKTERHEEVISLENIRVGDILIARAGDYICADGVVVSGRGWSDQSAITGDSHAQLQDPEMPVLAASILTEGHIEYRADRVGEETTFSNSLKYLDIAQNSKSSLLTKNENLAASCVLGTLGIAVIVFLFAWLIGGFEKAMITTAILLIAVSPASLAFAALLNIQNGFVRAIKSGLWFKDATALEDTGEVSIVALDKTGTLTAGKPQITDIWTVQGVSENRLIHIAASLERHANHPIANAIAAANPEEFFLETSNLHFAEGGGVSAHISNKEVRVGSLAFTGVELPAHLPKTWQTSSVVSIALGNKALGALALQDSIRNDSIETVNAIYGLGLQILLLSDDRQTTVENVAHSLKIRHFYAELTEISKREIIKRYQSHGSKVAAVGIGEHNAPGLETADIGILVYEHNEIKASNVAVLLVRPSILGLVEALKISRSTLKNIKKHTQLFIAYNAIAITLAVFGLLPSYVAALMSAVAPLMIFLDIYSPKKQKSVAN